MWKKRLLIISLLGNIFSLLLIGIYFLVNSWFFHAELGSVVGIKPDYLVQLNNEGVLYDYRQMIKIASDIDEKQYDDFIGRIKVIDGYENVPIRYRRLIESDHWEYL